MRRTSGSGAGSGRLVPGLVECPLGRRPAVVVREPERALPGGGLRRAVRRPAAGSPGDLGIVLVPHASASRPGEKSQFNSIPLRYLSRWCCDRRDRDGVRSSKLLYRRAPC